MSILDKRYARLGPSLALLKDEAVLAQAWKKTDTAMRRHNWYADILELEQTSLLLPQTLRSWAKDLNRGGKKVEPAPARLVLAPKNARWHFPSGHLPNWSFKPEPKSKKTVPDLRPLAHVSLRDQVLASAVMLCVADAVETLQGDTDMATRSDASAARKRVCSYGNRLFCDWSTSSEGVREARFRWGNANTYSQFFKDYERFLERPADVCREMIPGLQGERLFVVKLDLAKFYDCIQQGTIVPRLRKLHERYAKMVGLQIDLDAKEFWKVAKSILTWRWDKKDEAAHKAGDKASDELKLGVPQGLVAGGFFANAYMHDFDQQVVSKLDQKLALRNSRNSSESPLSVRLLDYCRYVDDMRVVVAVPEASARDLPLESLAERLSDWMNEQLTAYEGKGGKLCTKSEKSEAIAWEDFAVQGSTSQFMRGVQGQISTAPDPATLLQATGSLDHLLWLADALDADAGTDANPLALARISLPRVDVRDDTIKRFAANRLRQVLRLRRSMADPELPAEDSIATSNVTELEALDHEMETVARKLVACWSRNPALVTVLRCGLDLYPSPELLRPVIEALMSKLDGAKRGQERLVAIYVLADLFKAAAVETGLNRPESYPAGSDIGGCRSDLVQLALRLSSDDKLPWYLQQQIALFLAVMRYPMKLSKKPELAAYRQLHRALRYETPEGADTMTLAAGLLVLRITGQVEKFVVWLGHWFDRLERRQAEPLIDHIAMVEPAVLTAVWIAHGQSSTARWTKRVRHHVPWTLPLDKSERLVSWSTRPRSLAVIAAHPENPFVQENALLKLARCLLEDHHEALHEESLSIHRIRVECGDWSRIQSPTTKLKVHVEKASTFAPPWNATPPWCAGGMAWAYHLGRMLRASIVGDSDFTTHFSPLRENSFDRYRGLNTSWYKRRMGLMPLTAGLGAEPTPISPWLNELVMRLLQWPGLEINRSEVSDFDGVKRPADLLKLVRRRQQDQRRFYGKLSRLPAYLLPVDGSKFMDLRKFKVALVQTLLPKDSDFSATDPLFWTPGYRARHRAHLASMCRLIIQHLAASRFGAHKSDAAEARRVDLIVFPELSVHPDDVWLLHRLSDSTGATVFAGQTFVHHPYLGKPINRAVWLLRQTTKAGRSITKVYQGKQHGIPWEISVGIAAHRPYQVIVQFTDGAGNVANLTGAVCYDATDLRLAADLRDVSDGFVVPALNKDINTFDTMANALQFHMYQPVMLANTGQYGGSTAQAPYKQHFDRHIAHVHGNNQAAVSLFDIDLTTFKSIAKVPPPKEKKSAPAGFLGRA